MRSRTCGSRASTAGEALCSARIQRSPPWRYSRAPTKGRRSVARLRLDLQKDGPLPGLEDVVPIVDGLGAGDQLAHPVHGTAFLADDKMRIR